ncbi:hypothetical protein MTP99_004976 [Tenebrio molitor]|nr:hypothetical protein MTP99_004976 [Tenebrio molitor]
MPGGGAYSECVQQRLFAVGAEEILNILTTINYSNFKPKPVRYGNAACVMATPLQRPTPFLLVPLYLVVILCCVVCVLTCSQFRW